jgi:hypothetical protein
MRSRIDIIVRKAFTSAGFWDVLIAASSNASTSPWHRYSVARQYRTSRGNRGADFRDVNDCNKMYGMFFVRYASFELAQSSKMLLMG